MPEPLTRRTVAKVRRLAAAGCSQRAIAHAAHVSLGSVNAILRGRYRTGAVDPRLNPGEVWLDPPARCPCGAKITISPCRSCGSIHVRQRAAARVQRAHPRALPTT